MLGKQILWELCTETSSVTQVTAVIETEQPPVVLHKEGRSSGSCAQDQISGKHETALKDKS